MSWVYVAVGTVVASSAYSSDQQRKAVHGQQDAMLKAQEDDARQRAEIETAAQMAAGAATADAKRRRRASALGLGAPADMATPAAAGGSVLSQGRSAMQPQQKTTLLGGGGGV